MDYVTELLQEVEVGTHSNSGQYHLRTWVNMTVSFLSDYRHNVTSHLLSPRLLIHSGLCPCRTVYQVNAFSHHQDLSSMGDCISLELCIKYMIPPLSRFCQVSVTSMNK